MLYFSRCSDSSLFWTGSACWRCQTDTWKLYGSSCYFFSADEYSYTSAKTLCSEKHIAATLAIPNSSDELSFLNSTRGSGKSYFVRGNYFLLCDGKFKILFINIFLARYL